MMKLGAIVCNLSFLLAPLGLLGDIRTIMCQTLHRNSCGIYVQNIIVQDNVYLPAVVSYAYYLFKYCHWNKTQYLLPSISCEAEIVVLSH